MLSLCYLSMVGLMGVLVTCSRGGQFCHSPASCDLEKCQDNLDIAIVGAGPAGAYSAYRLRDSHKAIGVYEYSDRVGGRLFTLRPHDVPDVHLEIGGMRFIETAHNRLEHVIEELGLGTSKFVEGFGRRSRTRYHLRGHSLTYQEVLNGTVPYQLNSEEKANQHRLIEYFLKKLTGWQPDDHDHILGRREMHKLRVPDGRLLYQLSFDEAFDLVASPEGKEFVRDTHVFTTEVTGDASALSLFDFYIGEDTQGGDVYTVAQGMDAIPRSLINRFLNSNVLHFLKLNHHLKAIRSKSDKSYVLYFQPTTTELGETTIQDWQSERVVCARQVILALPVYALTQLDWPPLKEKRAEEAYNALRPIPASKVFLMFKQPWWLDSNIVKNKAFVTRGDLLFSQMYDWKKSEATGDYIMIASYADNNRTLFEKHLRNQGATVKGSLPGSLRVSSALQNAIMEDLATAYGADLADIPQPVNSLSQFWTDYPFGCGWVTPRVGYNMHDLVDTMRRPSLTHEVYVVGSDYSWGLMSSWVEGAFETAEDVIFRYFSW